MSDLLSNIESPNDLKKLSIPELKKLSQELRDYIISSVAETGGHLAPSLGVVELTLVLHYLFDSPTDKIVWDVGHQAYVHKILTGRKEAFKTIRKYKGISGFPKISESVHDAFGVGHSSTAISAALGLACSRDIQNKDNKVLAIVGDGALTGGLAYEGLNNAGASGRNFIVILNDNSMSISPNVGAISKYLTSVITNPLYNRIKSDVWRLTGRLSKTGTRIRRTARRVEESLKGLLTPGVLFERLGFRYFGPVDGHDIPKLLEIFKQVKKLNGPILVHVQTKKGKGFEPAEKNATVFHGLGSFDPETGELIKKTSIPAYTSFFGKTLVQLAEQNDSLIAITGAMAVGTGLLEFSEKYPKRFFDVGIAEGHAVTFSAGAAVNGMRPVVAIYSSFLQRAYDSVIHDVALQKLPVIFALDRAGLVGDDGPTHHGVFDMAFMRHVPNMVVMAPKDENELRNMLYTATQYKDGPISLRYPRGSGLGVVLDEKPQKLPIGISETIQEGKDIALLAVGTMVDTAVKVAKELENTHHISATVVNARFVKPLDTEMLTKLVSKFKLIVTLEEGVLEGGFGSAVSEYFIDRGYKNFELVRLGIPNEFVPQGSREQLLKDLGLDVNGIIESIHKSKTFRTIKSPIFHHLKLHK